MDDGGWMDREEPVQIGVPFSVEHIWWHMTSGVRSQGEGKARVHVCLATNACVPACLPACLSCPLEGERILHERGAISTAS